MIHFTLFLDIKAKRFDGLLEKKDEADQVVEGAPWWVSVEGANWKFPYSLRQKPGIQK